MNPNPNLDPNSDRNPGSNPDSNPNSDSNPNPNPNPDPSYDSVMWVLSLCAVVLHAYESGYEASWVYKEAERDLAKEEAFYALDASLLCVFSAEARCAMGLPLLEGRVTVTRE